MMKDTTDSRLRSFGSSWGLFSTQVESNRRYVTDYTQDDIRIFTGATCLPDRKVKTNTYMSNFFG